MLAIGAGSAMMLASPLSPEEALGRIQNSQLRKMSGITNAQPALVHTFTDTKGLPTVYAFNKADNRGYILLSADDVAAPVLGYADSGSFDFSEMSPEMGWWIGEYSKQINYAILHGQEPYSISATRSTTKAPIEPLVKVKWNQNAPFNNMCPELNGQRCVTGCVATALAQVMSYWKYPEQPTGTISYTPSGFSSPLTLDLNSQKLDWSNMLDVYTAGEYNTTQANAVAYLMKACGYSVKMDYDPSESGAVSYDLGTALINNFGYNKNITYEAREYYTNSDWNDMVYAELAAGRPVLYGGQSEGGGHQFVCDGYSDGYFHINWGWGGMSNGYFLLESLNPDSEGIGGGSGGYNFDQDVIRYVQPTLTSDGAGAQLQQTGSVTGTISGNTVTLAPNASQNAGWWNMTYSTLSLQMGVAVSAAGSTTPLGTVSIGQANFPQMGGFSSVQFQFPSGLSDGKYLCRFVTKDLSDSNAQWLDPQMQPGMTNGVYVVKQGSNISIENIAEQKATFVSGAINGPLYYQCLANVSISMKNSTDVELSQTVAPVVVDGSGNQVLQGSSIAFTLEPGTSIDKTWDTQFTLISGATAPSDGAQMYLMFTNMDTGSYYDFQQPVTVNVNTNGVSISVNNFTIADTQQQTVQGVANTWVITNPGNIQTSFRIQNNYGYYGYPTYVFITPHTGNSILKMTAVKDATVQAGQSANLSADVSFEAGVEGTLYDIGVLYYGPSGSGSMGYMAQLLQPFVISKTSDVSDISDNSDIAAEYYDLQGRRLSQEPETGVFIRKAGTSVEKIIR